MPDQFAIYRVDLNTDGWRIKDHSYDYVRKKQLDLSISNYRQIFQGPLAAGEKISDLMKRIHNAVGNPTLDSVGVSDVLVVNRDGVINCYYIDKTSLVPLKRFIRTNHPGSVIDFDTKGFDVEGKPGGWNTIDGLILDGKQYYLMESQQFPGKVNFLVLDAYGKLITDEVVQGFDDVTKIRIREALKKMEAVEKQNTAPATMQTENKIPAQDVQQTERMLLWQKYLQNGTWERRSESGTEANYDMIDGRVNNQVEETASQKKKPKKRESVIRKLHQKQIAIAKKSGKPIPMYLEAAERRRG